MCVIGKEYIPQIKLNFGHSLILLSLSKTRKAKEIKKVRRQRRIKKMQYTFLLTCISMCLFRQLIQVAYGDENWSKKIKMGFKEGVTKEMT